MQFTTRFVRPCCLAFLIFSIVSVPGCGSSSSASTLTTPTATATSTLATDTFTGSIEQKLTAVYPFRSRPPVMACSPVTRAFALIGRGAGSGNRFLGCIIVNLSLNVSQNDTGRSGSTALTGTPANGNYCLRIYDAGNIPTGVTASYTVQVQHY